jgi:hypothetical protein
VDALNAPRIIPVTNIMRRYQLLRKMHQADRLKEAKRLVEHPEGLATEFAASVAHFARYTNPTEHFYPPERAKREFGENVTRTNDLVLRLEKNQSQPIPVDAPHRLMQHDAGSTVTPVPVAQLAFDYVDRELLLQRTTSPAKWEDGTHNRGGVRLDVLLADLADRTPIVAELKLPGDMDPFFALVQALACAAHLATANQYQRMREHLTRGRFPKLSGVPRLDVWLLFVDGSDHELGQPPKGRYIADLKIAAEMLAPRLLAQDAISGSVRRIAGLGMTLDEYGSVASDVRWAWARE